MMRIWGRRNSINVQKVMWTVGELGLKHERVDAGLQFGRNKEPDFLKMNPNGLVPVLQDDDLTLWESNVIVRYLAARYADDAFWPKDPGRRALSDKWMDWMITTLNPAIFPTFWGLIRTPPEQRDMKAIEAARAKTADLLKIFETHMTQRAFVGGDALSVGDIPMGVFVKRWFALPIERPSLPNVAAYYDRLKQRPAFVEHVENIPLT
ncbi:MAG TPA: glutathione S-transferase family protein [Alphaproteobacteria bacterium]|nr:glutathione S-transferase family protein [Alphaproteobacteria bacterium]